MWRIYSACLLVGIFGCLATGCGSENPFKRGPEVLVESDDVVLPDGAISFATHVTPVLASCVNCHRSGVGGWTYSGEENAYSEILAVIDAEDPPNSALLIKGSGGDGHGGGALFSQNSVQYETLLRWIEQGASNN